MNAKDFAESLDILGMMTQAGFGRAATHGLTHQVWKDGIGIDKPNYAITAFAAMVAEQAAQVCAQIASDQTSDDPAPGDWNAACKHIADTIRNS